MEKTVDSSVKVIDIDPIEAIRGQDIANKTDLGKVVEPPLLKACEKLYDLNIRTLSSSANRKNIADGVVYITLDVASMSQDNIRSLREMGFEDNINNSGGAECRLTVSVNETSTFLEVEQKLLNLVARFKVQPMTWAPRYTLQELQIANNTNAGIEEFVNMGLYYSPEEGIFYLSKEHYEKVKEFTPS